VSTDHAHCTPEVVEQATGAVEAQQLVDAIVGGRIEPKHAWLCFAELQARHGRSHYAAVSFITQLAKIAAKAGG
jgi:hypothetical protein